MSDTKKDNLRQRKLCGHFDEYCNSTSIHGIKYLAHHQRSLIERLSWLVVIVFSLSCCVYFILKAYKKWENSPVIVTFGTGHTPVWEIPFPAVTICPEAKTKTDVYNLTDVTSKLWRNLTLTNQEKEELGYMNLLCIDGLFQRGVSETSKLNQTVLDFFSKVGLDFEEVVSSCWWTNSEECSQIFTPILTAAGICYSFNILDRTTIYRDSVIHYNNFHTIKNLSRQNISYPITAPSAGKQAGLDLYLHTKRQNLNPVCGLSLHGFKIAVHHPTSIPRMNHRYFQLPLDHIVLAAIKPDMITTAKELKSYDADERLCYFPNEKHLRFFKVYSQENCEIECLTNLTFKECDCVSFYMPREKSMDICGPKNIPCMEYADGKYLDEEECQCLPSCTEISYDVEISQAPWDWLQTFQVLQMVDYRNFSATNENISNYFHSNIVIFFKEMQFITKERHELYGYMDFFASCGGLLGLFIGFSVISAVEILYYLLVKFFDIRSNQVVDVTPTVNG